MTTYTSLRLIIADPTTTMPPALPDATNPTVTVWRDREGAVCALGHIVAGERWMHLPGVASFRFDAEGTVTAVSRAGPEQVIDYFRRTVWPTALQARGKEVLHASAVSTAQGVVAFCAVSETGKSTLAYGLSRRGYRLWADDAVVFEAEAGSISTLPLPFNIRLRPASAVYFSCADDEMVVPHRWEDAERQGTSPLPLAAICLLEQVNELANGSLTDIGTLPPAKAFARVLSHASFFSLQDKERKLRMMRQYFDLVSRTPVFAVRFQRGLNGLSKILDEIEQAVLHRYDGQASVKGIADDGRQCSTVL